MKKINSRMRLEPSAGFMGEPTLISESVITDENYDGTTPDASNNILRESIFIFSSAFFLTIAPFSGWYVVTYIMNQ